ncbi:MAG: FAD-dependent monooxygenase [Sterolibacterium sp.]|nr:FAD-dependent monooxygenase [Sterolibacterium sp.]
MVEPTYFGSQLAALGRPSCANAPVAIIGGGLAGMTLALALHQQGVPACIFDARGRGAARDDPRALALAHGSQQTFAWLGIWPAIAAAATPIASVHVSQRGGFGRTRITAAEQGVAALGQVVAVGAIVQALDAALSATGIVHHEHTQITRVTTDAGGVCLQDSQGRSHHAPLAVYAEGTIKAAEAGEATEPTQQRDYQQQALVFDARISTPHQGVAYERFTPQGPLALLPCGAADNFSVVYTCAPQEAQRLLALPEAAFLDALQTQFAPFGQRLRFVSATPRHIFPLGLRYRQQPIAARRVWLGNAAQTLHPVAGQGFNLALRDIRDLARVLTDSPDPGAPATLQRYAAARRADRGSVIHLTDGLVRLFSNDHPLLRPARGLGLLALDLLPPARRLLARQLMYGQRSG